MLRATEPYTRAHPWAKAAWRTGLTLCVEMLLAATEKIGLEDIVSKKRENVGWVKVKTAAGASRTPTAGTCLNEAAEAQPVRLLRCRSANSSRMRFAINW